MTCPSCLNQRAEAVEKAKKGQIIKATLIAIDGVAVMAGLKNPNAKYLEGDKDVE
jgi:ABC-type phosphate transport system substrate-binding protein